MIGKFFSRRSKFRPKVNFFSFLILFYLKKVDIRVFSEKYLKK